MFSVKGTPFTESGGFKVSNKSNTYAYVRVSSKEQNEARQVKEIIKLGVSKNNIIIEKATGSNFNRSKYKSLVSRLKSGDTLYINSINRLGRDYDGILKEWAHLTKNKKVFIKVLDMPILNTDKKTDNLMDKFIRDMTLLTLAYNAEQDWQNIKASQRAGIIVAKETGKHLGRPKTTPSENDVNIIKEWTSGNITADVAMRKLKKKKSAFYQLVQDLKEY
jgi:DNA invertase Pin-like site-specific DNA recombinase